MLAAVRAASIGRTDAIAAGGGLTRAARYQVCGGQINPRADPARPVVRVAWRDRCPTLAATVQRSCLHGPGQGYAHSAVAPPGGWGCPRSRAAPRRRQAA